MKKNCKAIREKILNSEELLYLKFLKLKKSNGKATTKAKTKE